MTDVAWVEASTLGSETAHATWALAARMLLEERAHGYHAVVSHDELADYCQERTRIRGSHHRHWIGDVLWRVMEENHSRREPFLSSLAVTPTGQVWSGYAGCVAFLRGGEPTDADDHAAHERLECYRRWADDLPADGGVPGPLASATRRTPGERARAASAPSRAASGSVDPRTTRTARVESAPKVCPRCFLALPASGLCDDCD